MPNLTALYGFKEKVVIDPLASREWFETHADVVLYVHRGETPPWGHWTSQGYAVEWPVEILVDPSDPLWALTAQEDVPEERPPGGRLGAQLKPFEAPPTEPRVPVYALYGFLSPTTLDVGRVDAEWLDEHADAVIFALDRDTLPFGHFLTSAYACELVVMQLMDADDERVATARLGLGVYAPS